MSGLRRFTDSSRGPALERQGPWLTRVAGLLAGLAILQGAKETGAETAESRADTSEAVVRCPTTWTVCAPSSTPDPCFEEAPADSTEKYRYCTHGLDWQCNYYITGDCWYSSTPCAEDTPAPPDDPKPGPCIGFSTTEECGYGSTTARSSTPTSRTGTAPGTRTTKGTCTGFAPAPPLPVRKPGRSRRPTPRRRPTTT